MLDERIFKKLIAYSTTIDDPKIKYQYLIFIVARYNTKLNENASIIRSMYDNRENKIVLEHPDAASAIQKANEIYQKLVSISADMDTFVSALDPTYNYMWGTRWLHAEEIKNQEVAIAELHASLSKHRDMSTDVEDWTDGFLRAIKKA